MKLTVREAGSDIAEGLSRNIAWKIDNKGKLTVTGTGDYDRKNEYDAPWQEYCRDIKTAEINVTDMTNVSDMFSGCANLVSIDVSHFDTGSVTEMRYMFADCTDLDQLDLSSFKTSQVTDMRGMFSGCISLKTLELKNFETGNVTDMAFMFDNCNSLENIDLSSFETGNVTDMSFMFANCHSLKTLDVSYLDTSSVNNMFSMFGSCRSLKGLDVSCFNTKNVTDMGSMFSGCTNLEELDLSNFSTEKVQVVSGIFAYCSSLTSINMSSFDLSGVTEESVKDELLYVEPFEECGSLSFLCTPRNCSISIKLPGDSGDVWYQEKDKEFSMIPTGLDYSIELYKNGYPGDGKTKKRLTVSGIMIEDKTYDRDCISYSGAALAKDSSGKEVQDISFDYAYSGTLVNGNIYEVSAQAPSDAGDYTLTVSINGNDTYEGRTVYHFCIRPKELNITAVDYKINAGANLPEFTYTVSGLVEGDQLIKEPTMVCSVPTTDLAGVYDIIPSGADAGNNYIIRYVNGTLSIGGVIVVKFDLQSHGTQIPPVTVNSGDKLIEPAKPEAEGYTFDGWYKEAACINTWNFDTDTVTADITLYAKWILNGIEDKCIVTYDMQGHGKQVPPATVNRGDKLAEPAKPEAEGYTFDGWHKEAACINAWNFDMDTVTADVTLYAKWTEDKDDSPYTEVERTDLKVVDGSIASIKAKVFDGNPYEPIVKVKVIENGKKKTLIEGSDYRVLYKNNIDAGTGTVIVRGNGIYKGELTKEFTIKPKSVKKLKLVAGSIIVGGSDASTVPIYVYDSAKLLVKGIDYDLSDIGNPADKVNKTVKVTISGKGNYTNTINSKISVYDANVSQIINSENVALTYTTIQYTGKTIKDNDPIVKIGDKTLVKNRDYKVQYMNNKNAGNAFVIVTGKGAYKGKVVKDFTITPVTGGQWTSKLIQNKTYNGKLQKPAVKGVEAGNKKLVKNRDYTVFYSNNLHAGNDARVIITGKGNYAGQTVYLSFTILPQKIAKVSVKGTKAAGIVVTYNGRVLKEGTDYKFEYGEESKNKVNVTITGMGDFMGSVIKKVKIQ